MPLTPLRCLDRARALFGSKVGLVADPLRFRFSELAERCERLAGFLRASGIEEGEPVAFLCHNTHQLLEGYFGAPLAGGLILPLNTRLATPELAAILNHSGTPLLFYEDRFKEQIPVLQAACPGIRRFVSLESEYERVIASAEPVPIAISPVNENSGASLFYTSGTTGVPRGVVLSHRALYLHALSAALTFHIDDSTVELYTVPLFHANGWGRPHAATLMGARQVLLPKFDAGEALRLIETERVTSMCLVPAMARVLLRSEDMKHRDLTSMREIHLGGSAVPQDMLTKLEDAFGCLCTVGYGMTETGPVATNAGRPVPGAAIRVVDIAGNAVPRDSQTTGEVLIGGDHLMRGYFGEPPRTEEWLATGDLGVWDEDACLALVDRKKDLIISGGENISPAEIERVIEAHPCVAECAVCAIPDERWGEVPMAVLVLKPGEPLTAEELTEWLAHRIAKFKIPKRFLFHSEPLPRTATGKVTKAALGFTPQFGDRERL